MCNVWTVAGKEQEDQKRKQLKSVFLAMTSSSPTVHCSMSIFLIPLRYLQNRKEVFQKYNFNVI